MLVPRDALVQQPNGSYHVILKGRAPEQARASGEAGELPMQLPVIQEVVDVQVTSVETGRVRVHKRVQEHEEIIDPPLLREEVAIERIPVNRVVDGPVAAHSEGDTLVIPLLEEIFVVEKRLLLREEVRVTKRRMETHLPQRLTLRREEATVEHVKGEGDYSDLDI
jgi:uncharacterized protein (TIGR02271 family)